MRKLVTLSLAALAGCASSAPGPGTQAPTTVRVVGEGGGSLTLTPSTAASVVKLPYAVDQVWRILPAVYDSLAIPITTLDPAKHLVANEGFKVRQKLGKVPLSRYIDCGATQIGANADSYDVYMSVYTHASSDGKATAVSTTLEAAAKPISFAQEYSRCSSRGVLESRIVEAIKMILGR